MKYNAHAPYLALRSLLSNSMVNVMRMRLRWLRIGYGEAKPPKKRSAHLFPHWLLLVNRLGDLVRMRPTSPVSGCCEVADETLGAGAVTYP